MTPGVALRASESPEPIVREGLQKKMGMQCDQVCLHLQVLYGGKAMDRKECRLECEARSSEARNRCLLKCRTSADLSRCAY